MLLCSRAELQLKVTLVNWLGGACSGRRDYPDGSDELARSTFGMVSLASTLEDLNRVLNRVFLVDGRGS